MSGETLPALGGGTPFNYPGAGDPPAPRGVKILVLTEGHVCIPAVWDDNAGFLAWAPCPSRNKDKERTIFRRTSMTTNALPPMQPIKSSQIAEVGHDAEASMLYVKFNNGGVYSYGNVDTGLFQDLITAPSVGSFFSANIKNRPANYPYEKV